MRTGSDDDLTFKIFSFDGNEDFVFNYCIDFLDPFMLE